MSDVFCGERDGVSVSLYYIYGDRLEINVGEKCGDNVTFSREQFPALLGLLEDLQAQLEAEEERMR